MVGSGSQIPVFVASKHCDAHFITGLVVVDAMAEQLRFRLQIVLPFVTNQDVPLAEAGAFGCCMNAALLLVLQDQCHLVVVHPQLGALFTGQLREPHAFGSHALVGPCGGSSRKAPILSSSLRLCQSQLE